jgi:hypothetical protein
MFEVDELGNEYNRFLTQFVPQATETQSAQGAGIVTLQGLSQANITIEGAASGVRIDVSTNNADRITLLIVGLGDAAAAGQLANQANVTTFGSLAPAAYDQTHQQAVIDKLNATITAFNALLTEMQTQQLMA